MFFTGSLPTEMGDMESLKNLFIENNQLVSQIPSEMGQLENLRDLRIFGNILTGDIPATFSNLVNLETFYMDSCQLRGGLTDDVVRNWVKLGKYICV
mmetsp:Transcript_7735/g.10766  ORF Transcript_7735/g.10766 Transcript_7735/m.10766 type:complete len:97 (+) Transcript_7735:853-1143(+)